ncbi:MAG: glycosyltransferase family 2 protein [Patescibacteria group bacterium]
MSVNKSSIKSYPIPQKASLSVVIPVYNAEQWMKPTLDKLWTALSKTKWHSIEIIVVDDGSTDGTAKTVKAITLGAKIRLITQSNAGRFLARQAGLNAAKGDYVFFIDSRVFAQPESFNYLVQQMNKHPEAVIWNGHVEVERDGNPYARFWHAVTFMAWHKYMANPRLVHYGYDQFDYYPKGTTCFFAPRDLLLSAYAQFKTVYSDLRNANDDSALIRYMAKETDIYIAPGFAFTYHSRSSLKAFARHTAHRGVVFIDGFMHRGTRYYYWLIAYLIGLPLGLAVFFLWPLLLLALPLLLVLAWLLTLVRGVPRDDAAAFALILPVFALFYTAGLYKGLVIKWRDGLAGSSARP